MEDYTKKTRDELIAICKERKIKGYSGMKKGEIIQIINDGLANEPTSSSEDAEIVSQTDDNVELCVNDSLIDITHTDEHRLKVGTLFSGIGAFEHALQRLNIEHDIVFACDNDEYVKTSYFGNYNIKEDQWYNDVKKLNATKYLSENIDIVIGGSPCQSFSSVGKQKGLDDDRGNLIFEFIRVVNECKPKMFIFENVKGLTTQDGGKTFEHV